MTDHSWEDVRDRFRMIAAKKGVCATAKEIPATRMTVYRLITGRTKCPSRAVCAGIRKIVESASREEDEDGLSSDT